MTINRRQFITAGPALLNLPLPALSKALASDSADSYYHQFHQSLDQRPWLSAYESVKQNSYGSQAKIIGKWPADLRGTLYRNGPAKHEIGSFRYHHPFDGDGMIQAFRITDTGVSHQAKMIATHKYIRETAAGRALYPTFGTEPPNPAAATSADAINPGNISVLHHHGKLLALWEAGSAWEMDAESLETKGTYSFSDNMKGAPFSAHPRVEPDGTLWNFGYVSYAGFLVLWHIDAAGKLVKAGKVNVDPITMPHDFVVTAKHIVFLLPPFDFDNQSGSNFLDRHRWQPDQATRVLVVSKEDFSVQKWLDLPAQWVFHFSNAWEDRSGKIRFESVRYQSPDIMTKNFKDIMRGNWVDASINAGQLYQYEIDTKKWTVAETPLWPLHMVTEFPTIDPRVSCQRHKRIVMLSADTSKPRTAPHFAFNEVSVANIESGEKQFYQYPDSQIPEEHLFVSKPGSAPDTDGWLLGTTHNWVEQTTLLNVFDFNSVDAGPIAQAVLPYVLPLGLHGKFVEG